MEWDWKYLQSLKVAYAALRWTEKSDVYSETYEARNLHRRLDVAREKFSPHKVSLLIKTRMAEVASRARVVFAKHHTKSEFVVSVGKVGGSRKSKGRFTIVVSPMWSRYVNGEIYSKGFWKNNVLILKATPIKVNFKKAVFYECVCFDMLSGDNITAYVAKGTIGKEVFVFANTIESAVSKIEAEIQDQLTKKLTGEDQ